MAGGTRGKLKEQVEGLHSNFDWARVHATQAKALLNGTHPELSEMFDNVIAAMETMDAIASEIYSKL